MKNGIGLFLLVALSLAFLSCGGGETSGTPGTEGGWNPIIVVSGGFYCNNELSDTNIFITNDQVDAFYQPSIDCNPNTTPIEPEIYTDHFLYLVMFNADFAGRPGSARTVTITEIDLEYRRPDGAVPGAPVLQSKTIYTNFSLPPVTEEETLDYNNASQWANVVLVSIATKEEFRTQYESGERVPPDFPTEYQVVVTIKGASVWDDSLEVTTVVPIYIGDYDYCECVQ